ncbi:hypothetical protein ACFWNK_12440 [Streptomyces sp. NPDC058417]|uniref:hypothetical protein n=1 Tax=unclassified Streptomyces TaxID=2593676 RepID=UPI003647210D
MPPGLQRDLIPRNAALHPIDALNALKDQLRDAAQQWELLDENGHLPTAPPYTTLLQHAVASQDLSCGVLRLTADFARSPYHPTPAGSAVLKHLAVAATLSSHAVPRFTETAESALLLPRIDSRDRHRLRESMVMDHGTARAYLRSASGSLGDAAKELHEHLGFQHFTTLTRHKEVPTRPPRKPDGRHL